MTDEQKKLVEDNHNLIYSFLIGRGLSIEEHYGLAAIGLCRAAMTYKADMSMFPTYAYRCMFNSVYQEERKKTRDSYVPDNLIVHYQTELYNDNGDVIDILSYLPSEVNVEDEALSNVTLERFMRGLSDRDRAILDLLSLGYGQRAVAKVVGCSQAKVSRLRKSLMAKLLRMF